MKQLVYECTIGSGTYYTIAETIESALIKAKNFGENLDIEDSKVKAIMCIAEIDF